MSLILDALKKAQSERKSIFVKPEKKRLVNFERPRKTFYFILAGGMCLALIVFFIPVSKKSSHNIKQEAGIITEKPLKVATNREKIWDIKSKKDDPSKSVTTQKYEKKDERIIKQEKAAKRNASIEEGKKEDEEKTERPQTFASPTVDKTIMIKKDDYSKVANMFNAAIREAEKGNFEGAKRLYFKILEEKPDHIEALNNLGIIEMSYGNTKEALSYYRKILEISPDYSKAYNNMGLILLREGDKKLAEEYFRKAIELNREGIEAYINLSALLRSEKRLEEASKLLEPVVKKDNEDTTLYLTYAIIKDELGDTKEAIKYYRYYMRHPGKSKDRNKVLERLKILEDRDFTKSP